MTPETTRLLSAAPPPLWFVTNGEVTVGPVTTNLLLRGIAHERVPDDCLVRERRWSGFRALDSVREVAALRREIATIGSVTVPVARYGEPGVRACPSTERLRARLAWARDPSEVLNLCLLEAVWFTGALVGLVHRRTFPYPGLVTVGTAGPGLGRQMGLPVYRDDPVLALAQEGRSLFGEPGDLASAVVQDRLGGLAASSGVAMVPVHVNGRLYALLELGRPDHAFRDEDVRRVARIARAAAERFDVIQNPNSARVLH